MSQVFKASKINAFLFFKRDGIILHSKVHFKLILQEDP
jgi:hypothetical protein